MTPTPCLPDSHAHDRRRLPYDRHPLMHDRRRLLRAALALAAGAAGGGAWTLAGAQGAALQQPTPRMMAGPFYPDRLPAESDADLSRLAGRGARAAGQLLVLSGRVLDTRGQPQAGAEVELWQANTHGRYMHSADTEASGPLDPGFQGYGLLITDAQGRYRFTTVLPGPYGSRTPHLHFNARNATRRLTTQMFFEGEKRNERDGLFRSLDQDARRALTARPAEPAPGAQAGALALAWDIVLPA
jgi:protocatechuate 3,4-dioxygenase beta subunit